MPANGISLFPDGIVDHPPALGKIELLRFHSRGAWQFRRVFWVGFSLEGQEILDLGLRWLAEHLRGGFIFPL
ncbi:MAG: hypothetical protein PHV34_10720, partial [Verrucomicrobiae bacterium]|nr:hypothetical protein [Verrucomicrobiae bacterium]